LTAVLCAGLASLILASGAAADPLFASDEVLSIELEGPFRDIIRDRDPDPAERPGVLRYTTAAGVTTFDAMLAPRGKSRRTKERCQFPPLSVNLKKSDLVGTLFENQDRLKLVTHCRTMTSKPDSDADYVWLEYLAYRIFNEITPASFRARPLEITYIEAGSDKRYPHPGFFIEHKARFASRLGLNEAEIERGIENDQLDPVPTQVAEIFQYLIGNTDFSFIRGPKGDTCCHNAMLYYRGDVLAPPYLPVPYDFDSTGLVDPPKALPAEGLGIRRVTQRVYRGRCRDRASFEASLAKYRAARGSIEALITSPPLTERARKKTAKFVAEFFAIIDDPKDLAKEFFNRCPG
jgi:hypothetical protein